MRARAKRITPWDESVSRYAKRRASQIKAVLEDLDAEAAIEPRAEAAAMPSEVEILRALVRRAIKRYGFDPVKELGL